MLGAIIGDIVGSRWEFNPTNDYNFEWLSDQNGFTDDTICTVAVADAATATAIPSHNHDEGIKGAQTVVLAIFRALQFGREASQHIKEILTECAEFAKYDINIKKENVINKFDETCQGTVPVALWIIGQSTSFEDAVRKAVALGADADTLGAIVGSIAEAIWGIPREMKLQALEYLPSDMKEVVTRLYSRYIKDGLW